MRKAVGHDLFALLLEGSFPSLPCPVSLARKAVGDDLFALLLECSFPSLPCPVNLARKAVGDDLFPWQSLLLASFVDGTGPDLAEGTSVSVAG